MARGRRIIEDDDDDESQDGSVDEQDDAGLFDLEAAESDGAESDESSEQEFLSKASSFPKFLRLPLEVRFRVWEFFCPSLLAKARVFDFMLMRDTLTSTALDVWEGGTLALQTATIRSLLATCSESRTLALKSFPDELEMRGGTAVIRVNLERDLISVDDGTVGWGLDVPSIPKFTDRIRNLALANVAAPQVSEGWDKQEAFGVLCDSLIDACESLPSIKTLYYEFSSYDYPRRALRWCASGRVNMYYFTTEVDERGLGEDAEYLICWPDLEKHRDYALAEVRKGHFIKMGRVLGGLSPEDQDGGDIGEMANTETSSEDLRIWPLIRFNFSSEVERYDNLLNDELEDSPSPRSDLSNDPEDRYESSGIDDEELDLEETSEEEDDLIVQSLSEGEPSPLDQAEDEAVRFSSLEPDSANDDESIDQASRPRARKSMQMGKSRQGVVISDSEDEAEEIEQSHDLPSSRHRRRRPVVESDSDSDSEDDDDKESESRRPARKPSSESEDDDEDDGEDDEDIPKPMSLAERLQLHRRENPISSDAEDSDPELGGHNSETYHDENSDDGDEERDEGLGIEDEWHGNESDSGTEREFEGFDEE
jgi:hypothetical protein